MANKVAVNVENLKESSKQFKRAQLYLCGDDGTSCLAGGESVIDGLTKVNHILSDYWQGDSSKAFTNSMNNHINNLMKLNGKIRNLQKCCDKIASLYKDADAWYYGLGHESADFIRAYNEINKI